MICIPNSQILGVCTQLLSKETENTDQQELYYGVSSLVGDGSAGEFIAFKEVADKLPDVDELIKDPSIYKKMTIQLFCMHLQVLYPLVQRRQNGKHHEAKQKLPVEFQVIWSRMFVS